MTYWAYQRLQNFACQCLPPRSKLLVYLKVDPKDVDLVPAFTRLPTAVSSSSLGITFSGQAASRTSSHGASTRSPTLTWGYVIL